MSALSLRASFNKQDAEAAKAVAILEQQGAIITDTLKVEFTRVARALYDSSPFARDVSAATLPRNCYDFSSPEYLGKGLLSRVSRVVAATQAAQLHAEVTDNSHRIALLSASGESVGQFWSSVPCSRREAFENLWFRTSLRQRLNLTFNSSGHLCQLRKAERGEELCLKELTTEHVYCCQTGTSRFRPHRSLIISLADALRNLGAYVDVERYCADLLRRNANGSATEAWLDVCAQFPGQQQLWRLDVTTRSSWAQHGRTSFVPGLAAASGIKDKQARYGETVRAISLEPPGRMAPESVDTMWQLAHQARDRRGAPIAPGQVYRKLRLALERTLLWSMAERLICALGREAAWPGPH